MTGDFVDFEVIGEPIPQGSKTVAGGGGKVWLRDSNAKKLKPWRDALAEGTDFGVTFDVPVRVTATFWLTRPKTVRRQYPGVKPDLDKLMRSLGDGMTAGGLISDDSIIVDQNLKKRYADGRKPGVTVRVEAL